MNTPHPHEPARRKPLRLWPGVIAVVLQWLVWLVVPLVVPDAGMLAALGGLVGGLAVLAWWLFFSRAAWFERLGAVALAVVALVGTSQVIHPSIANGMMGFMLVMYAIPVLSLALVVWAVASRRLSEGLRRASLAATILLACGAFALLRTSGVSGAGGSDFGWRWSPSPEERLLSRPDDEPTAALPARVAAEKPGQPPAPAAGDAPAAAPQAPAPARASQGPAGAPTGGEPVALTPSPAAVKSGAEWPGFRGPDRDGIARGRKIETDWSRFPPVELWRRPIGPGWSSFAVSGDVLFTQEQRGEHEIVACYKVTTGEPVWQHRDPVRFWESNGGAGPRATPTLEGGRVYALGATGILNALDASDGAVMWSRNVASETGTAVPTWGFAGSPLIVDDNVIVAAAGTLAAYDLTTGKPRWVGPVHAGGYSSPHRLTIGGVVHVLLQHDAGVTSVAPGSGAVLWEHAWPGAAIVQPAITADGDVLVSTASASGGLGMRRMAVASGPGGWTAQERWTSTGLKPYFNDLVVHKGHAFGFDGSILSCIAMQDGMRAWKGGRYGYGQLLLLPDQDVLLVLSEEGELALVGATPDQFRALARFPAIEGKTWNHPVLVGDILLVRNGEEMAAFRLPVAGR
jgi:outer membrane protein assembly factor BamB